MHELRTEPRQRRSQLSIDAILDAAEHLIRAQGQVSFTANELALAARMSIGRIYYWFPDIPSVVNALVERGTQRMVGVLGDAVANDYSVTTPVMLQGIVGRLCTFIDENPATVALCLTGGVDGPGRALSEQLTSLAAELVRDRVPEITDPEVELVASTTISMLLGMLHSYLYADGGKAIREQEIVYALSSYLYARFPPPGDFSWRVSERSVRPSRPSRRDFTTSGLVYPALSPEH